MHALNVLNLANLKGSKHACFGDDLMILNTVLQLIYRLSGEHKSRTNNMHYYSILHYAKMRQYIHDGCVLCWGIYLFCQVIKVQRI